MATLADVEILQPVPYFPAVRPLPAWARSATRSLAGLAVHQAPMLYLPGAFKRLDWLWLSRAIRGHCRQWHEERPLQVIDAHFGYPEGAGCARIAREFGVPLFVTIRGFETEFVARPDVGPQLLQAMRHATGIVAVSDSLRTLALEHGIDPSRVAVIHNAIDAHLFHFRDFREARLRLEVSPSARLIVSVGHLVRGNGHHVLLASFHKLLASDPGCRLVIIGSPDSDPAYRERLAADIRHRGIEGQVAMLGVVDQSRVADWLAAADIFALGTAREGCCNAVLEALAVGTPVVTTPTGDNKMFVRDGANGFIVPIDDVDALADGLTRSLLQIEWDRAAISRDLLRQVASWNEVAARVVEFMRHRLEAAARAA